MKNKFPRLPINERVKMYWRDGPYIVACVEKREIIKLYFWDEIAFTYNKLISFEKL